MKVAAFAVIAVMFGVASAQLEAVPFISATTFLGSPPASAGTNNIDWTFDFELPLWYGTTYEAGLGPYDSDNIFGDIDEGMHFEEYGIEVEIEGEVTFFLEVGDPTLRAYTFMWALELELLDYEIYKQILWWSRAFADFVDSGFSTFEIHFWLGASYKLEFGEIYLSYEESAVTGGQNLLGFLLDGTDTTDAWAWGTPAGSSDSNTYDWDDEVYRIAVIDFLPADI